MVVNKQNLLILMYLQLLRENILDSRSRILRTVRQGHTCVSFVTLVHTNHIQFSKWLLAREREKKKIEILGGMVFIS